MKNLTVILLVTALTFAAVSCSAAESDAWKNNVGEINLTDMTVSGTGVSVSDNTVNITAGGDFTVSGTLENGMIYVNTEEKVKLRLSGASITNTTGPAILFENTEKALITLTENTENYLEDGKEYNHEEADAVIFSNDDIEIKGDGKLTVKANYKHGIAGNDDVSIENGVIAINSYEHGIKVNDTLSVLGGTITVNTETGKGMKAELEVIIDGGAIDITTTDEAIESKGTLTINGGDINIVTGEDGLNTGSSSTSTDTTDGNGEGMPMGGGTAGKGRTQLKENRDFENMTPPEGMQEGEPPQMPADGQMPLQGGRGQRQGMNRQAANGEQMPEGQLPQMPERPEGMPEGGMGMGGGFGRVDEETAKAHALTINGGNIYINAAGDGIDSNGNLTINGGTVIVDGPENSGNGPIDSDGTTSITGGEVILASSAGMLQLPQGEDNQNIIRVMFSEKQTKGTEVTLTESESGKELVSHTPQRDFQAFVFSSEAIESGKEYTIYINGEKHETVTATDGISSVGNAMGMFGGGMRDQRPGRKNTSGTSDSDIKVEVEGKNIDFETKPVIKNDSTLVGFRAILEALGAEVTWDDETKTVTATKDDVEIVLTIGSGTAYVNGEAVTLLIAPEIISGSTMIPVRFISEQMGMDVEWNGTEKRISVRKSQK